MCLVNTVQEIREDALDILGLPLKIKRGVINSFKLKVCASESHHQDLLHSV